MNGIGMSENIANFFFFFFFAEKGAERVFTLFVMGVQTKDHAVQYAKFFL